MEITVKVKLNADEIQEAIENYLVVKGIKATSIRLVRQPEGMGEMFDQDNVGAEVEGVCQSLRKG